MAFTAAGSGRPGPVALIVPADLFNEAASVGVRRSRDLGRYPLDRPVAEPTAIAEAARLIAAAERPIVIAGGGIHLSRAELVLSELQQVAHLPVATTTMGKGAVAETHPLSVGVVGYFMGPHGMCRHLRDLVAQADVVLLIGSRTNQNGTDSWQLLPADAAFIHLDADGQEVGRNYEALRLVGDARSTLTALLGAMRGLDLTKRNRARAGVEAAIAEGRRKHREEISAVIDSDASPIRPERLMAELARRLNASDAGIQVIRGLDLDISLERQQRVVRAVGAAASEGRRIAAQVAVDVPATAATVIVQQGRGERADGRRAAGQVRVDILILIAPAQRFLQHVPTRMCPRLALVDLPVAEQPAHVGVVLGQLLQGLLLL